jgi:CheY-like chemotaxis protein
MDHEIRTPVTSIVGLSHLCLQTDLGAKQRDYLEKIQQAAVNLMGLINDILDFSKIESGQMQLEPVNFRLDAMLRKISDTVAWRAAKSGLEFLFRVAPDVPEYLNGDPYRLSQALINLVGNSVRFTERGEVVISVDLLETRGSAAHLCFSVRDTGAGISRVQLKSVNTFFSQPECRLPPDFHPDACLGFSLAHMLMRMMNGKVWAESGEESGNIFHVSLWLEIVDAPPASTAFTMEALRNMRVLVVDDHPSSRLILAEMLTSMAFRVDSAESGAVALEMLRRDLGGNDPYLLVFLDWKMPGMDGIETARRIRELPGAGETPQVIMLTAGDIEGCRSQGLEAGVNAFLSKPLIPSSLFDGIVGVFAQKRGTRARSADADDDDGFKVAEALRGARILLVEDNEINQQIAEELLRQVGVEVTIADNGKSALECLQKESFDAVLMDIQMPIMDGLEAARRVRELPVPGTRTLPILAMTAHALESDRRKSFEAGMQDHLTKPITPKHMYEILAKWVAPRRKEAVSEEKKDVAPEMKAATAAVDPDDVPGLSVSRALRNLGGNRELYKKLLRRFTESYSNLPEQVLDALRAEDRQLAVRLAHTVKGVAGNLGAFALSEASAVLEKTLAAEGEHAAPLERVAEALRQALEGIELLLASTGAPGKAESAARARLSGEEKERLVAFLTTLPDTMSLDWTAVQDRLKGYAAVLGHGASASAYSALAAAVDDFDVDGAREQSEKLVAVLHG